MASPNTTRNTAIGAGAGLAIAAAALAQPAVEKFEGLRNDPYWDIARVRSVCYGETKGVQERRYTDAECKAMLTRRLQSHATDIAPCMPVNTPLPTYAAFASFAYNVGAANACGSTAAKRLRSGDVAGACEALTWWDKVKSPVTGNYTISIGLTRRRAEEKALCLQGAA